MCHCLEYIKTKKIQKKTQNQILLYIYINVCQIRVSHHILLPQSISISLCLSLIFFPLFIFISTIIYIYIHIYNYSFTYICRYYITTTSFVLFCSALLYMGIYTHNSLCTCVSCLFIQIVTKCL